MAKDHLPKFKPGQAVTFTTTTDAQAGQVADHLAERRVLATHAGQIGQAQLMQPQDILVQARCSVEAIARGGL